MASDLQARSFTSGRGARLLMLDLMAHGQACVNKERPSVNPIRQCVLQNMWTMKNEPAHMWESHQKEKGARKDKGRWGREVGKSPHSHCQLVLVEWH